MASKWLPYQLKPNSVFDELKIYNIAVILLHAYHSAVYEDVLDVVAILLVAHIFKPTPKDAEAGKPFTKILAAFTV